MWCSFLKVFFFYPWCLLRWWWVCDCMWWGLSGSRWLRCRAEDSSVGTEAGVDASGEGSTSNSIRHKHPSQKIYNSVTNAFRFMNEVQFNLIWWGTTWYVVWFNKKELNDEELSLQEHQVISLTREDMSYYKESKEKKQKDDQKG